MLKWDCVLKVGIPLLALGGAALLLLGSNLWAVASPEVAPPIYYVDAAVTASGDGSSWDTAFKTIGEATAQTLQPGSIIWVRPGTYPEDVGIDQSGAEVTPMTTGVQALTGNRVVFPAGSYLSGIDLAAHPGEYYLYLAGAQLGGQQRRVSDQRGGCSQPHGDAGRRQPFSRKRRAR